MRKRQRADGRMKHPLFARWNQMCHTHKDRVDPGWRENFWNYVKDVGECPRKGYMLRLRDRNGRYEKGNLRWVAPLSAAERADRDRACVRRWHRKKGRAVRLERVYGITQEDYDVMLRAQGGVCKICGQKESVDRFPLAVDHDHKTGKVRGLLCGSCNTGLGKFNDDPDLLLKAMKYLGARFPTVEVKAPPSMGWDIIGSEAVRQDIEKVAEKDYWGGPTNRPVPA